MSLPVRSSPRARFVARLCRNMKYDSAAWILHRWVVKLHRKLTCSDFTRDWHHVFLENYAPPYAPTWDLHERFIFHDNIHIIKGRSRTSEKHMLENNFVLRDFHDEHEREELRNLTVSRLAQIDCATRTDCWNIAGDNAVDFASRCRELRVWSRDEQ